MAGGEEGALPLLPRNARHIAFDTAYAIRNTRSHFTAEFGVKPIESHNLSVLRHILGSLVRKTLAQVPQEGRGTSKMAFLNSWTPYDLKNQLVVRISLKAQPFTQDFLCSERMLYASQKRIVIP